MFHVAKFLLVTSLGKTADTEKAGPERLVPGQNNTAFLLGSRVRSFHGAPCFLPHSSSMPQPVTRSQKGQRQCWRAARRRLIYEKQLDGSQSVYGIEQKREEASSQEVAACQEHPVNVNGAAESPVVIPCGHTFSVVLCYVLCLIYLLGTSSRECREVHDCSNLEPIMNFFPFLFLVQEFLGHHTYLYFMQEWEVLE